MVVTLGTPLSPHAARVVLLGAGVLAEVEAAGTAVVVPTARAARLTMDREGIRRLAAETLGLPTSAYRCDSAAELATAAEHLGFPCVVEPVTSSSGARACCAAPTTSRRRGSTPPPAGRRGVVDLDSEITLLTVRSTSADGSTRTSFCAPVGHRQVDGDYVESWQPHPMSAAALARARQVAAAVTGDLGGPGVVFDGVDAALEVPDSELRLFGPSATPGDVEDLRARAREAASTVVPRLPGS